MPSLGTVGQTSQCVCWLINPSLNDRDGIIAICITFTVQPAWLVNRHSIPTEQHFLETQGTIALTPNQKLSKHLNNLITSLVINTNMFQHLKTKHIHDKYRVQCSFISLSLGVLFCSQTIKLNIEHKEEDCLPTMYNSTWVSNKCILVNTSEQRD